MHKEDLSVICEEASVKVLAIGWLDEKHPFPKSSPSEAFLDALFDACTAPVRQTRGFHVCPFCSKPVIGPLPVTRRGHRIFLGSAEIQIEGDHQKAFAAPTLIYHYVSAHDYEPPKDFVDAVLARRPES